VDDGSSTTASSAGPWVEGETNHPPAPGSRQLSLTHQSTQPENTGQVEAGAIRTRPCAYFDYAPDVSRAWVEPVRSLLEAPSPAVLTTYCKDGSAHTVPVWYRWTGEAFEAVRPFRGLEARGVAELVEGDLTSARVAIAGRYLGLEDGERFAAERRSRPGVLLRLVPDGPRVWDLSGILSS
jgi:hypothetical protein